MAGINFGFCFKCFGLKMQFFLKIKMENGRAQAKKESNKMKAINSSVFREKLFNYT